MMLPQLTQTPTCMAEIDRLGWVTGICFASYGLRIGIRVNQPEVLKRLPLLLPPGWKMTSAPSVDRIYSLWVGRTDRSSRVLQSNVLYAGAAPLAQAPELDEILVRLEADLELLVAETAPRRVFVHAGAVGWCGRAILLPGRSFSGKSTLVEALVRAGATYYSDEYAVLDARGRVHPYPKPLSLREAGGQSTRRCTAEALGGRTGSGPLPVGLIAFCEYRPAGRWRPRWLTPGRAALALLAHTVPAIRKPQAVLTTLRQLLWQAAALKGMRGEAELMAKELLRRLDP
jgi:hypothetical protein